MTKKIAAGSFGTIFLAKWLGQEVPPPPHPPPRPPPHTLTPFGQPLLSLSLSQVAVKIPSNEISEEALQKFMQEIRLMSCLHHPNVVVFLGACVAPNICLVREPLESR